VYVLHTSSNRTVKAQFSSVTEPDVHTGYPKIPPDVRELLTEVSEESVVNTLGLLSEPSALELTKAKSIDPPPKTRYATWPIVAVLCCTKSPSALEQCPAPSSPWARVTVS